MGISDTNIVWEDESKVVNGIEFFPIQMAHYSDWLTHKRALTLRQSTLPAALAVMPYLSALYAIDAAMNTAFLYDTIKLMSLATRRPMECFQLHVTNEDRPKFAFVLFRDGDISSKIGPQEYNIIRKVLAEQNGEKLPDEGDNLELVEAEADIISAAAENNLDFDVNKLISSVSYQYRIRKQDLAVWSVREFEEARRTIERDKAHLVCAIAEKIPFFKWSKGNPCPSWCFDKARDGSIALESMSDFSRRTGVGGNSVPIQSPTN